MHKPQESERSFFVKASPSIPLFLPFITFQCSFLSQGGYSVSVMETVLQRTAKDKLDITEEGR